MPRRSLIENATLNSLYSVLRLIFPLITFPYVARIVGPEGVGSVTYVNTVAETFIALGLFGLPSYAQREIAKRRGDIDAQRNVVEQLLVTAFSLSCVATLCYFAFGLSAPRVRSEWFLFVGFGTSVFSSFGRLDWLFQGIEDFRFVVLRRLAIRTTAVVLIFVLVNDREDYYLYGLVWMLESTVASGLNLLAARREFSPLRIKLKMFAWAKQRSVLKAMLPAFALISTEALFGRIDVLMLGSLADNPEETIGLYAIASRLQRIVSSVLAGVMITVLPRVAKLASQSNSESYIKANRLTFQFSVLVGGIGGLILALLAHDLVVFFGGAEFVDAIPTVIILATRVPINGVLLVVGGHMLFMRNREFKQVASVAAALLVAVALNVLAIPRFSHVGAAGATVLAVLIMLVLQSALAWSDAKAVWLDKDTFKAVTILVLAVGVGVIVTVIAPLGADARNVVALVAAAITWAGGIVVLRPAILREAIARFARKRSQ